MLSPDAFAIKTTHLPGGRFAFSDTALFYACLTQDGRSTNINYIPLDNINVLCRACTVRLQVDKLFVAPDEKIFYCVSPAPSITICDLNSKKSHAVTEAALSEDVIRSRGTDDFFTCSLDMVLRRRNRQTGECIRTFIGHGSWVSSVVCDEASKRVFSASGDKTIMMWNAETGAKIGEMRGHSDVVTSIAFVNPATVVSGSLDNTIKIWDTATMTCVKTISSHEDSVKDVSVFSGTPFILSVSDDRTAKIHFLDTGECVRTFGLGKYLMNAIISADNQWFVVGGIHGYTLIKVCIPLPFVVYKKQLDIEHSFVLFNNGNIHGNILALSEGVIEDDELKEAIEALRKDAQLPLKKRAKSTNQLLVRSRMAAFQMAIFAHQKADAKFQWFRDGSELIFKYALLTT